MIKTYYSSISYCPRVYRVLAERHTAMLGRRTWFAKGPLNCKKLNADKRTTCQAIEFVAKTIVLYSDCNERNNKKCVSLVNDSKSYRLSLIRLRLKLKFSRLTDKWERFCKWLFETVCPTGAYTEFHKIEKKNKNIYKKLNANCVWVEEMRWLTSPIHLDRSKVAVAENWKNNEIIALAHFARVAL